MTLMVELLVPTEWWRRFDGSSLLRILSSLLKSLLPALNAWQAEAVYDVRASKRSVVYMCRAGSGSLPTPLPTSLAKKQAPAGLKMLSKMQGEHCEVGFDDPCLRLEFGCWGLTVASASMTSALGTHRSTPEPVEIGGPRRDMQLGAARCSSMQLDAARL